MTWKTQGTLIERDWHPRFEGYTDVIDYPTHEEACQAARAYKAGDHTNDGMSIVHSVDIGGTAIFVHYKWNYNFLENN